MTRGLCSLIIALAAFAGLAARQTTMRYEPVDARHLAHASKEPCALPAGLRAKPASVVESPYGGWTAIVQETDPGVVPYDQAHACIQLRGAGGATRFVTISDFRMLRVQWVNARLLYIFTDVGHVAGVGQLLDVEDLTWLYSRTEFYAQESRPEYAQAVLAVGDFLPFLQSPPDRINPSWSFDVAQQVNAGLVRGVEGAAAAVTSSGLVSGVKPGDCKVTALRMLYEDDDVLGKKNDLVWEVRVVPLHPGGRIAGLLWVGVATGKVRALWTASASTDGARTTAERDLPASVVTTEGNWLRSLTYTSASEDPIVKGTFGRLRLRSELPDLNTAKNPIFQGVADELARSLVPDSEAAWRAAHLPLPANGTIVTAALLRLAGSDPKLGSDGDLVWELHTLILDGRTAFVCFVDARTGLTKLLWPTQGPGGGRD